MPANRSGELSDATVPELVAAQVRESPEKVALIYCNADGTASWSTYGEVWALATAASRVVKTYIPASSDESRIRTVGILIDEGPMLPIIHLATLMSSAALVPLDYKDPRLPFLLEEAECDVVIAKDDVSMRALELAVAKSVASPGDRPWPPPSITLTTLQERANKTPATDETILYPAPSAISHIYYTSGSSGRPKGALSSHMALSSYCQAKNIAHGVANDSVVFVASAATFDPSLGDFCATWIAGATLACTDAAKRLAELGPCLRQTSATHILTTPSLFNTLKGAFGPEELPCLQTVALGGEPMSADIVTTWADRVRLLNTYGVTECCVYQAYAQIGPGISRKAIGLPLAGNELLVMTNGREMETFAETPAAEMRAIEPAAGSVGELWIAGKQVGNGYLYRPELSAQKFVHHPVHGACFRTGDIVSAYAQGDRYHWRLVGRLDAQIKINGQRFDPGETEAVLLSKTTPILLARAAVVYHPETKLLLAYCVPEQGDAYLDNASRTKVLTAVLRAECAEYLPPHMCPARFLLVSELPQTSTGKIARALLARQALPPVAEQEEEALPPYGGWSAVVQSAWAAVLGTMPNCASAHFAELGGDSLAALRVCKQVANAYRREGTADEGLFGELLGVLAPAELLKRPTLGQYARYLYAECGALGDETCDAAAEPDAADCQRPAWESHLFAAAGCGATTITDFLVRKHGLPNNSPNTPTALHTACLNGHAQIAGILLSHGANPSTTDQTGAAPLHLASQAGSVPLVTLLLAAHPSVKKGATHPTHRVDFARQTPVHRAARSGAPSGVFTALLSASPDVAALLAARDQWGRAALHWAVVNGHRGCVAVLLEWGADRKAEDDAGEVAVDIAERRARCGASERGAGVVASVFADIAKLLGGSGTTNSVKRFVK
ncbi:hypothetical protein HDU87_000611 [Geranomyces variabilis]|uniref:Polyketide synthase-like phosphopantetheine-binding domain-containing protein n=1 Tax=Geranomyces variabilis TaxID=109894 RepID=A0AAD5TBV6_9FUNG|nr:hypothetical protein HDU87_000611 [Geranomyces variabilis]